MHLLALEHVLSTADNIVDDPLTPFPEYAPNLVGADFLVVLVDWEERLGYLVRRAASSGLPGDPNGTA